MNKTEWDEVVKKAANKVAEYAREGARKDGVPFYYKDEEGRWVKEYPDGRRFQIVYDGSGKKEIPLV